jgi:hypothetical protein
LQQIDYNLADELRNDPTVCEKVQTRPHYAYELYGALCNMQWIKREVMPFLRDERWSCSWRYAGGIVADIEGSGDYMDYYCTGNEGIVTDEIKADLLALGWEPVPWPPDA